MGGRGKARARAGRVVGRVVRVGEGRRRRLGDWARMVALLKPWMGKETERRRGGRSVFNGYFVVVNGGEGKYSSFVS